MSEPKGLRRSVIGLFKQLPDLEKAPTTVIGGVAAMLRLEKAGFPDQIRPTVDLDLITGYMADPEQIQKVMPNHPVDMFPLEEPSGRAGPFPSEIAAVVVEDRDLLRFDATRIPVVGPVGFLVSKLNRSGSRKSMSHRGKDLVDVIRVWLAEPEIVKIRIRKFMDQSVVAEAWDDFKALLQGSRARGTRAVLEELDLVAGDMDFLLIKARLDALFRQLP